ncbi:uncharacterized protein K02A2.6-like, partial [Pseudonaja textilis]|uniref:uncharacterized protein K02A2.6-like n=1 Tax=Pseudonaja textilis TaxID=8673 RepID=UPI000EA95081
LLGLDWFPSLGLSVTGIHAVSTSDVDTLFSDFSDVFSSELGCYSGTPISFSVDPQAIPLRLKPRRVPFAIRPKLDAELDKLLKQGVLEPTDFAKWETPIVTPLKKDGSLRICADYKTTLNRYLQVSAYPVPVIQHLLHTFEPAELQTIVTHRGAFKCKRLQFGVSVAPGIFQSLMERILQGLPGVVPYFDDILVQELSRLQGCLLWGTRVVIPATLRVPILKVLHEGHPGIVRMKALARSYVWWPGMDAQIADWVSSCQPCQETRAAPPAATPTRWESASAPWSRLHIDLAGPVHGRTFLVVVDSYSKWIDVALLPMTTTQAVVKALTRLFVTHGLPDTLVSDNGPQFTSCEFSMYVANLGIRHVLTAPFHPASNGMAEGAVRSAKEVSDDG